MGFKPKCTWDPGKSLYCCIIFSGCVQPPQEVRGGRGDELQKRQTVDFTGEAPGEEMCGGKEELICLGASIISIPQF